MWKSETVKILQITSKHGDQIIYGLGDDEMVYKWSDSDKRWYMGLTDPGSESSIII